MSGQKGSSSAGGQRGNDNCEEGCGYDPSNRRHEMSYWEDRTDPREKLDDKDMRFNSHYYKVVDRQIAEDHSNMCQPQQGARGSGSGAQGYQKK